MTIENNLHLPHGWSYADLNDLVIDPMSDIVDGPFGSNLKASEYVGNGVPIFRLQNVERNQFKRKNIKFVTENKALQLQRHSCRANDILITKLGDPLGEACLVPEDFRNAIIVADLVRLRINHDLIHKRFLIYCLNSHSLRHQFESATKGTTRPRVNLKHVRALHVPLAPLSEQYRIVAKIEELFTKLDAGVEELRTARAQLKRYRQAVLKAAVTGELTKEWREAHESELQSASELLARILKERRKIWETDQLVKMEVAGKTPKGDDWKANYSEPQSPNLDGMPKLPSEWKWARLDALAAIKGGITKNAGRRIANGRAIPYLRVANVQRGYFDLAEIKLIEATEPEIAGLRLQNEDILFTEGGDRDKLGRGWVWNGELAECIHQNHIFRGRLFVHEMSARFISFFSNTFGLDYFLREGKQTTNLASINHTKLSGLPVPVPSSEEQTRIVEEIERCFSIADASEQTIDQSLKQAERMRQSILKQAFEGKLVPQDPNDEPVELLLERIKLERAKREAEKLAAKSSRKRFTKKGNKRSEGVAA